MLVGAVGSDFAEYDAWLTRHGVDTAQRALVGAQAHRPLRLHDRRRQQPDRVVLLGRDVARPAQIELGPVADRVGALDLVVVGPNDPTAMVRHTEECRQRGYAFAADPSQQLAWADGEMIRGLVDGADLLFTNEYESHLLQQKTGWDEDEVLARVGTWVTTRAADGVLVRQADAEPISVIAVPETKPVEPTGGGDALRAGFIAGRMWGLSLERATQLGSAVATAAVEVIGTQEYDLPKESFLGAVRRGLRRRRRRRGRRRTCPA